MKNKFKDLSNRVSYGWLFTIVGALLVAVILLSIFSSIMVIGDSMLPNYIGGRVDANQNVTVKGDKVIISKIYNLEYGDVVVFDSQALKLSLIKRVIGLEGDTIKIENNLLYRNGNLVNESYIKEPMFTSNGEWTVPKGYVFVLGDNRNNSDDSRYFGCIARSTIKGEVVMRVAINNGKIYFI